jgi:hypothetical protein
MVSPRPPEEIAMRHGRAMVLGRGVVLFMLVAHSGMAADAPAPSS